MQMISANGTEGRTDWNAVDWRQANRRVRNLRQRIFRASRENDLKKVRSLQKLMLRSRANTLKSVRLVTQENKGKHTAGVDGIVISTTTERNALRAIDTLKGLPGFVDFPQGFQIHAREPNKLSWTEGFARSS